MKKYLLSSLLLLSCTTFAGNYLTQEMETLRQDLKSDDPARRELTLRLADMFFDLSIKDDLENTSLKADRETSLTLYQEALKGSDGFAPLEGDTRLKAIFQSARLQDKLGQKAKAEALFMELHTNAQAPRNLKLEAALYLGELSEDRAKLGEAIKYYQTAVTLCTSIDTCNFAHYRLGWTYFKETKLNDAIKEIYLSMWDAKGQLRDQVVNDLISFMSQRQTDGKAELKEIEAVILKSKNQDLMAQMAETFYLAGNREAGGYILSHINKKKPSLYNEIRLLEESYGFRKWDDVEGYLNVLARRTPKDLPVAQEEKEEALKIHRRLIVQLDAESDTNPDRAGDLKGSIEIYLTLYPVDEMKTKMQEGWLKVEKDDNVKMTRLGLWIDENTKVGMPQKEINHLRRTRLSLAQKNNKPEIVIAEAHALAKTSENVADTREYEYVAAYELNKLKKTAEAEVLFKKIIDQSLAQNIPDQWMIQSQNLLLDNYNTRKDLAAIVTAVGIWTTNPNMKDRKDLQDEFAQMKVIAGQASFEKAVAGGDSKESLEHFYQNCKSGIIVPQSCDNAKVLSVKLKDQAILVSVLELTKDEAGLMNEYELMGRFSDAARLREKHLSPKSQVSDYLRVSLLFELDLNFKDRNRVLMNMVSALKGPIKIDPKFEKILFLTLVEADMVDSKVLGLGWSVGFKVKLAQVVEKSHGDANSRKVLLAEKTFQGPIWSRVVLDEMQKQDTAQRKVSFYGTNSEVMFKRKMDMISRFENQANSYLQGSDSQTRVYLLSMMQKTNKDFAAEIINTPMPSDLNAAMIKQVRAHLQEMASAYLKGEADYAKLMNDEIAAIENKELAAKVSANVIEAQPQYASFIVDSTEDSLVAKTSAFDYSIRKGDIEKLGEDPTELSALTALEKFYTTNKSERIASYFKERIQLLKN